MNTAKLGCGDEAATEALARLHSCFEEIVVVAAAAAAVVADKDSADEPIGDDLNEAAKRAALATVEAADYLCYLHL